MIDTKFSYARLELGIFETFKEKLSAVIDYIEIHRIFCALPKNQYPDASPDDMYYIVETLIPGGASSYIKSLLQENLTNLQNSLSDYVSNSDNHFSIQECLETSKDKCLHLKKKYDINKILSYNENDIKHVALRDGRWRWIYSGQLEYSPEVKSMLTGHYAIRKEFFEEMTEILEKKLAEHLDIPAYPQKPYKWESENAHLEIAELLNSLIHTRIKIKEGEKGSTSKLVKEFYNLFGLDDRLYHQKSQQIRKRQNKSSWLQELPDAINSIKKTPQPAKKEP